MIMELLIDMLPYIIVMLAAIPPTALLCRYRIARKKGVSYGTMFAGTLCVPLVFAVIMTCEQPDVWWSRAHKCTPVDLLLGLGFMAAMCVLPALGVVLYYQRRNKKDETHSSDAVDQLPHKEDAGR